MRGFSFQVSGMLKVSGFGCQCSMVRFFQILKPDTRNLKPAVGPALVTQTWFGHNHCRRPDRQSIDSGLEIIVTIDGWRHASPRHGPEIVRTDALP